ncbi:MAG TPA: serine hydrolase [Saprospiraceae bacterium]|nr:serine hydrolase [Saprospiraceae bacterium]HNT20537.1 serine hydrolase [Saprospiraceae bacterium]
MRFVFILILAALSPNPVSSQDLYFPPLLGNAWQTLDPSTLGWCPDRIDSLYGFLHREQTKSFLVLKDGRIVLEKYFGTYTRDSLWSWYSAGKSLKAVLVGIAQEEGFLDLDDRVSKYLGQNWTSLPAEKEDKVTIRHQLTMTSGLNELFFFCVNPNCLVYTADAGTRWVYHNGPYTLTKAVLEKASGQALNPYMTSKIKLKTGMGGLWIYTGTNSLYYSTARDMARFGLLILNRGRWGNTTVIQDTAFFNQMISSSQTLNPSYGYLWWLNGKSSFIAPTSPLSIPGPIAPDAPADVVVAGGSQGQLVSISFSKNMVMIRQGVSGEEDLVPLDLHNEIWKKIGELNCPSTPVHQLTRKTIRIHPNPARDKVRISMSDARGMEARIYDLNGRRIKIFQNREDLDLEGLHEGAYLLEIIKGGSRWFEKIILSPGY